MNVNLTAKVSKSTLKYIFETAGVGIEECFRLKSKIYLYLVDDNCEHKKASSINKNDVATISHNECKDAFLNKKCLRHSMNMVQSNDHKIGTSCSLELIIKNPVILITIQKSFFVKQIVLIFFSSQKSFFVKKIVFIFNLIRTASLSSKINLKNAKHLKKEINEKSMPIAWHQASVVYNMGVLKYFSTENCV